MPTITLTIFSLKEKIVFLRTQMIETEALTFGGWGHFFLIIKAIPQCLRIRIMLKKCWHRLTLEIRARHFFSILTLFFSPALIFGIRGMAQFMAREAKFLLLTSVGVATYCCVKEWDLVTSWVDGHTEAFPGEDTRRRNRTGPSERTVFMVEGTRATQRLLLRTSISSLKAMGTESNFEFYKTKRIQQILYFFFFYISMNTIYPIPKACFSIFVNAHTSAQTLHP